MRYPLAVIEAVRAAWPDEKPLSVRISAVDGLVGGWTIEDSVIFAGQLKRHGVDLVDCSSGGVGGSATAVRVPRSYGFQVPFAEQVRREAGIATIAVGLIVDPVMANNIIADGSADIVALGREALVEPNWPHLAARALSGQPQHDRWPKQVGWWLDRRDASLASSRRES
jgi:2,4-dienoyl-CoA reductase-like NADH-dependent reductase (Old Yellow Enzyme family)